MSKTILECVTGDWQRTADIAMCAGVTAKEAVIVLYDLEEKDQVETIWDHDTKGRLWRLYRGGFKTAKELMEEGR